MKILLYVNSHLPRIGGRELVVHQLAAQYQELGHEVCVAGAAGWWKFRHSRFSYPVLRWPVVPHVADISRRVALRLFLLRHHFDVIHAHSTYPCAYNAARLALKGLPLVVTPHGEDINVVPEIGFGQRLDPEQAPKIEFGVRQAAACTAISATVYQSLLDAGVPGERVVRIRNGVDIERFRDEIPYDVRSRFGLPETARIVTSIGNYHPRKGHETLVEAVAAARQKQGDIALVIAGRTSEEFCAEVERKGYSDFVKFAGTLPVPMPGDSEPDVLAALLQQSCAYVSSSIDEGAEGLSLALLEGMAAGACPVVTNISGSRDVIADGVNGHVVAAGSVPELAEALVKVVSDPEDTGRLLAGARETVSGYSWRAVAKEYIALYEQVAGASAAGSP